MKYIILLIGVSLLSTSIYYFTKMYLFKVHAQKTTGEVIEIQSRFGGKYKIKEYSPVISFTTSSNKKVTFTSTYYRLLRPHNTQISVYYTENPLRAIENTFMSLWGLSLGIFLLSILFIFFFIFNYISR